MVAETFWPSIWPEIQQKPTWVVHYSEEENIHWLRNMRKKCRESFCFWDSVTQPESPQEGNRKSAGRQVKDRWHRTLGLRNEWVMTKAWWKYQLPPPRPTHYSFLHIATDIRIVRIMKININLWLLPRSKSSFFFYLWSYLETRSHGQLKPAELIPRPKLPPEAVFAGQ